MKKVLIIGFGVLLGGILLFTACGALLVAGTSVDSDSGPTEFSSELPISSEPDRSKPKKAKPTETAGQENARRSAEDYLDFQAFSESGLIKQLKFEGFTTAQATYGAKSVGANWNEQAVRSAKNYLDGQAFSKAGLVEQLKFEGFTAAQATYGADRAFQ